MASAQSMLRTAPCASVKLSDQVWCSSSRSGSPSTELESLRRVSQCGAQRDSLAGDSGLRPPCSKSVRFGQLRLGQQLGDRFVADALVHLVEEAKILARAGR